MTPMVDVVLVILIFFMAVMGLAVREAFLRSATPLEARAAGGPATESRPEPRGGDEPLPSRALLRLTRVAGRTVVTGMGMEGVALAEVDRRLQDYARAGAQASLVVVVAPGPDVPYQDVVIVHDACARAGIANVRLGVVEPG